LLKEAYDVVFKEIMELIFQQRFFVFVKAFLGLSGLTDMKICVIMLVVEWTKLSTYIDVSFSLHALYLDTSRTPTSLTHVLQFQSLNRGRICLDTSSGSPHLWHLTARLVNWVGRLRACIS